MLETLDAWLRDVGVWGYPILVVAALLEYVFPPFPGDTMVLLGGAWAERGERSLVWAYVALLVGSQVGIAAMWLLGRSLERRLHLAPSGARVFGIPIEHLRRAQGLMHRHGTWILLGNRFLPSARSVIFLAAGAARVSLAWTLCWGTVSAAVFNGFLLWVGHSVGHNVEAIALFLTRFRNVSWGAAVLIALVLLAHFFWRRSRAQSRP